MKLFFISLTVFLFVPFFVFGAQAGDIVLSEVAYDLAGADDGHEWVEVYNASVVSVDLTSWKFNDGANHLLNAPPEKGGQGSLMLPAAGVAVFADDAAQFLLDHPGFSGTVIDTVMSLNNTAATLTFLDRDGVMIDTILYQKEQGGNGNGKTLESINGVWQESAADGGTPGAYGGTATPSPSEQHSNATSTLETIPDEQSFITGTAIAATLVADAGEPVIARTNDEILFDGSRSHGAGTLAYSWNFGDGATAEGKTAAHRFAFPGTYIVTLTVHSGSATAWHRIAATVYADSVVVSELMPGDGVGGWIELANHIPYAVDVSGWGLGAVADKPAFVLPKGAFVAAEGFAVFSAETTSIALPERDGALYLFYPNGDVAGSVRWPSMPEQAVSAALAPDGRFVWTAHPTPGSANIAAAADFVSYHAPAQAASSVGAVLFKRNASAPRSSAADGVISGGVRSLVGTPAFAYSLDEVTMPLQNDQPGVALLADAFSSGAFLLLACVAFCVMGLIFYRRMRRQ